LSRTDETYELHDDFEGAKASLRRQFDVIEPDWSTFSMAILAFPSDFDIIMTIILVGLTSSKAENRAELTNTYEHNDDFGDGAELSASGLLGVIKPDWLTVDWL
jgi:hypothetical protein